MQAIQVKFLPPSNVRGARLKAKADAGSVTISYPHEKGQGEDAFLEAANALRIKLGWTDPAYGRLVGGQLPDGTWAFVFADGNYDRHYRQTRENAPRRRQVQRMPSRRR